MKPEPEVRKPLKMSPYQRHKDDWLGCTRCLLHEHRDKVVLSRGKLPCDVLFVGEAPGESENALGSPFVGPAGQLLDNLISRSMFEAGLWKELDDEGTGEETVRIAFTNLIACIPHNETGNKYEVPKAALKACRPRLVDFCKIVKPKLVVQVGVLVKKHWDVRDWEVEISPTDVPKFVKIHHPAAILRAEVNQSLMIDSVVVTLSEAAEKVFQPGD